MLDSNFMRYDHHVRDGHWFAPQMALFFEYVQKSVLHWIVEAFGVLSISDLICR